MEDILHVHRDVAKPIYLYDWWNTYVTGYWDKDKKGSISTDETDMKTHRQAELITESRVK